MTRSAGVVPDVVDFLRAYPPFDALDAADVERFARSAEVEFHAAGETIIAEGDEPAVHLRVVRNGAVEIVYHARVLDLLGVGELLGHASMLSGLPSGFEARAQEDTLCYRIPAAVARTLLGRPEALGFVARSLLEVPVRDALGVVAAPNPDPAHRPVGALLRPQVVVCGPETTIRTAARRMTEAGVGSVVVDLPGSLGIVTDLDLRSRVLATGTSADAPVSTVMSAPAYTVSPDRLGGEVLLDMLDRGFRHFPVVSATGRVLGVVEDVDLVAVETRSSFHLRRAIARAGSPAELAHAARALRPTVLALHEARVAAVNVAAIQSVVVDALTRRLLELAVAEAGPPPSDFAWLALGSQARREMTPSSDVDSAIVWDGGDGDPGVRRYLLDVSRKVVDGLATCGLRPDRQGATASDALFVRSSESWARATRSWLTDPTQEQALILVSVVVDSRPVWGLHLGSPVAEAFRAAPRHHALLRQLARFSLSYRPPTGFFRGLVVEHSGEHRGRLDLKHGGLVPIVDLARWAGMAAGVTGASTPERLRAAAEAGTLPETDARMLREAFDLVLGLRLEHQAQQLAVGQEPDDHLDPGALSPLTRTYLKDAFRAVAAVQKRVSSELQLGVR